MLGVGQIWNQLRVVLIYIVSFAVMDALNSCDWCGRVEGEVKSYQEADSCFWCNDGLVLELVGGRGEYEWGYYFSGGACRGQGGV